MNPKILKLREEHDKNKTRISELSARNRELEKQIRELENTEIIGLVRARGMSLEDFILLMNGAKAPVPVTPVAKLNEMEESEHEEL